MYLILLFNLPTCFFFHNNLYVKFMDFKIFLDFVRSVWPHPSHMPEVGSALLYCNIPLVKTLKLKSYLLRKISSLLLYCAYRSSVQHVDKLDDNQTVE